MSEFQPLASSAGYDIRVRDGEVRMVHRATRAPALVAWIAGGLTFLAAGHAVLWPVLAVAGSVDTRPALIAGAALAATAVGLFCIARAGYRAYKRRRDAPFESLPGYVADLRAGQLRRGDRDLAALADVRIDAPRNLGDSTQGSMRWVRLRWPRGKALVLSAASREAERVAARLIELGCGRAG